MSAFSAALRSPVYPLALLRIVVGVLVLVSPEPYIARDLATRPPQLWFAPEGLGFFVPVFAALAPHLALVHRLLQASCVLVVLGLRTRAALLVLSLCFFVLFGGAQLTGTVLHDMHLLWMLLLLLASPCAAVWALDARGRPEQRRAEAEPEAGRALLLGRLLLGFVYFFPGLHKLEAHGLRWALSDNLQNQLHFKWYEAGGVVPSLRPDTIPGALAAAGLLVLLFELGFIAALWSKRARYVALGSGLLFHAATQYFLYIRFPSLWLCYVVLLGPDVRISDTPATSWAERARTIRLGLPLRSPLVLVAIVLLPAVVVQGLRGQTESFPFACYPTFEHLAPDAIVDLAIELDSDKGTRTLRLPQGRSQQDWGTTWRVAGLYGRSPSAAELHGFAQLVAQRNRALDALHAATQVRYYRELYAVAPEAAGAPARARAEISVLAQGGTYVERWRPP